MYDVIVVGARVAGSSTGILLARRGLRVLVVDRTTFPSDTLSTHQIQVPGVARLANWGLLDRIVAAGTPATRKLAFDAGSVVLRAAAPVADGADAIYSPRRTVLDAILVDAARDAGAEVREHFTVDELQFEDGRVVGIRGRDAAGGPVTERARVVVGADGKHSLTAKAVGAPATREHPPRAIAYYSYWSGVAIEGGTMVTRERRAIGIWPTNDGLVLAYVAAPANEFGAFRSATEARMTEALEGAGDAGRAVLAGQRADRFYGTADLPNLVRRPFGPGWALVGDAGLVMDPITGQGIAHALKDAQLLSDAIVSGLDGSTSIESALESFERQRDAGSVPMLDVTLDLAAFSRPIPTQRVFFEALAARPDETRRFFAAMGGVISPAEVFAPRSIARIVGVRGMARMMFGGILARGGRGKERGTAPGEPAAVG